MEKLNFEWDENKNLINQNKHKITFEEAKTVFYDEYALVIDDPEHSEKEEYDFSNASKNPYIKKTNNHKHRLRYHRIF